MTENSFIKITCLLCLKKASSYKIGYSDIGYDDEIWCVTIKNNRYVWVRKKKITI